MFNFATSFYNLTRQFCEKELKTIPDLSVARTFRIGVYRKFKDVLGQKENANKDNFLMTLAFSSASFGGIKVSYDLCNNKGDKYQLKIHNHKKVSAKLIETLNHLASDLPRSFTNAN